MTERLNKIDKVDFGDSEDTVEKKLRNIDLMDLSEPQTISPDVQTEKVEKIDEHIDLDEWEKDMEIRDRY